MAVINTESFKGPSTPADLLTKADVSGFSISDILKQGHWSKASAFQKIYRKDILDPSSNFLMNFLDKTLNKGSLQQ